MRILYWSQDICDIIDTFREPVRFTSYYLTISLLVKRESRDSTKDTKRKRWKCVWNLVKPKSVLPICDLPCPDLHSHRAGFCFSYCNIQSSLGLVFVGFVPIPLNARAFSCISFLFGRCYANLTPGLLCTCSRCRCLVNCMAIRG